MRKGTLVQPASRVQYKRVCESQVFAILPVLDDDVFGELRGAVRIELYDRSLIARTPQRLSQGLIHRLVASCERC